MPEDKSHIDAYHATLISNILNGLADIADFVEVGDMEAIHRACGPDGMKQMVQRLKELTEVQA